MATEHTCRTLEGLMNIGIIGFHELRRFNKYSPMLEKAILDCDDWESDMIAEFSVMMTDDRNLLRNCPLSHGISPSCITGDVNGRKVILKIAFPNEEVKPLDNLEGGELIPYTVRAEREKKRELILSSTLATMDAFADVVKDDSRPFIPLETVSGSSTVCRFDLVHARRTGCNDSGNQPCIRAWLFKKWTKRHSDGSGYQDKLLFDMCMDDEQCEFKVHDADDLEYLFVNTKFIVRRFSQTVGNMSPLELAMGAALDDRRIVQ